MKLLVPETYINNLKIIAELGGSQVCEAFKDVEFIVPGSEQKAAPKSSDDQSFLKPEFTFDNFKVNDNNQYSQSAALAVAEAPAEAYNPLYIYGTSGTGKTHLLHAIGNHLIAANPELNVVYVTAEFFANDLIYSLTSHKMREFKDKYRTADVLLIDDIQYLEGKENTQEEFYHTFNALFDANKQIVIASDKAPNQLCNMDDRLKSRFGWNLIAKLETKHNEGDGTDD